MRIAAVPWFSSILTATVLAGAPKQSPCTLVTMAEVQEAVGAAVSDGMTNTTNASVCDFKVGDTGSVVSIMLTVKALGDSAQKTVDELKKRNIRGEVVPGFGDSAYAASPGYGMQQLGVYKGSHHAIVTVLLMGASEAKSTTVAQAVMRKALTRIT